MNKYILQKSTQPNKWVLTDAENGVVLTFEQGKFNDTQKVTFLENSNKTANELATILREMGEWAVKYHKNKLFSLKQHGGKRTGAGRPKTFDIGKSYSYKADKDLVPILDKQDNRNRFINDAVREKSEKEGLL